MRLLLPSLFAAASQLAVACTGTPAITPEATPPPATQAPTPDATSTPRNAPSPSAVPHLSSRLLADQPVLEGSELGDDPAHYDFTLSGAYFTDNETHHAYVVGFGPTSGDQQPFHATSADGLDWIVDDGDPLASVESAFSPPGPIPGTVLEMDGQWVTYLWGVSPSVGKSQIYRATADDPGGPWTVDTEPVLPVGEPGDVDDLGLDFPAVVPSEDGFVMLYGANGGDEPNSARILLATSADGISWEKHGRVIEPALCGGSDVDFASTPRLFVDDGAFLALALMGNDIYALRSKDALTWTCQADEPAFPISLVEGGDRVHTYAAGSDGDQINLLIEALFTEPDGSAISNLWLAQLVED